MGCLQRTSAAGIAWQSSVRSGTASKDDTCGTNAMGQLGLQQTTAGCSALLGDSGVVHRRKTALATTWFAAMAAVASTRTSQRDAVVRRAWFGCRRGSWKRGIIVLHPGGDIINECSTRSTMEEVARPPHAVSSARRRERGGVQQRMWRAPRVLCFHSGDCEAACVGSRFSGSTLPDDVRCR